MTFIKLPVETFKLNEQLEELGIEYDPQYESTDIYVRKEAITMFGEREGIMQVWLNNSDENISVRMTLEDFLLKLNE